MQLSPMQFLLSFLIIILVFQASLKYFSEVFLSIGLICCHYMPHSLHDPSVGFDQSIEDCYFSNIRKTSQNITWLLTVCRHDFHFRYILWLIKP